MTDRPYLFVDIDGVLQAPSLSYGFDQTRVITERLLTQDVHPALWPRHFHGYGWERRWRPHLNFRTQVRVSPRLFEDVETLPVDVVMLTTWLENGSSRAFLAQATEGRTWFPGAVHPVFPSRAEDGSLDDAWKLNILRQHLASDPRPFIWVDDDEVPKWRETVDREFADLPHLLIGPDSNLGITREHVEAMRAFSAVRV